MKRLSKTPVLVASIVATSIAAAAISTVAAQQVTALLIADQRDATGSILVHPEGTQRLWVIYEYRGAARTRLTVSITAPGALTVFARTATYSGNGSDAVEVSGDDVYFHIVEELDQQSSEALASLSRVQTQQQTNEYVSSVLARNQQIQGLVGLLQAAKFSGLDTGAMTQLTSAATELARLAEQLSKLTGDVPAQRAIAQSMEAHVEAINDAAGMLLDADPTGFPFPTSHSTAEGAAYTVKVDVDGSASRTEQLWIHGTGVRDPEKPPVIADDPTVVSQAAATSRAGATQTTTTASALGVQPAQTAAAAQAGARQVVQPVRGGTATPGAGAVAPIQSGMTEPADRRDSGGQPGDQPGGAAPEGGFGQGGSQVDQVAAVGQPTWTLPAPAGAGAPAPRVERAPSSTQRSGPNPFILVAGMAIIGLMAVWVRRRR